MKYQHFVCLLFNLLLKIDIVISCGHHWNSHFSGKDHIHDVDLLNYNTVHQEFFFEIFKQILCEFSFDISNSCSFLTFYKVSNTFLAFLLKQFFHSIRAEVVKEFFTIIFLFLLIRFSTFTSTNVEVDSNI
jgi:hypothetical protein